MLIERIEPQWVEAFRETFELCGLRRGDVVALLSETQSRRVNVELSRLALAALGCRSFELTLQTPRLSAPVPVRSTGASNAIDGIEPVIGALAATTMVIDLTVEGLMHAPELPRILAGGTRVLYVSNEHPEVLERCRANREDEARVRDAMRRLKGAKQMLVRGPGGTSLRVRLEGARVGGVWGYTSRPGTMAHWPGGICLAFPAAGSVDGRLVLNAGDVNLTFKRYLESPVVLDIRNDYVEHVDGSGVDADLMRSYLAAWGDREAYAVSHVGWGLNPGARWDAMAFYDKRDFNGTELRAFAGNFLYSTGANEVAGRYTLGHFDLPLRGCTVEIDGQVVVDAGQLVTYT